MPAGESLSLMTREFNFEESPSEFSLAFASQDSRAGNWPESITNKQTKFHFNIYQLIRRRRRCNKFPLWLRGHPDTRLVCNNNNENLVIAIDKWSRLKYVHVRNLWDCFTLDVVVTGEHVCALDLPSRESFIEFNSTSQKWVKSSFDVAWHSHIRLPP